MPYVQSMRKKRLNGCHGNDVYQHPILSNAVSYKHKHWRLFGDCLCQKLLILYQICYLHKNVTGSSHLHKAYKKTTAVYQTYWLTMLNTQLVKERQKYIICLNVIFKIITKHFYRYINFTTFTTNLANEHRKAELFFSSQTFKRCSISQPSRSSCQTLVKSENSTS